jgi:hypothetical protein
MIVPDFIFLTAQNRLGATLQRALIFSSVFSGSSQVYFELLGSITLNFEVIQLF